MLSIFIASVLSIEGNPVAQVLFSILGLPLTNLWWRSVDRQHKIVEYIREVLYEAYDPYQNLRKYRDRKFSKEEQKASGQKLLVHRVPLLFGVFLVVILVIAVLDFTKIEVNDDVKLEARLILSVVTAVFASLFFFFSPAAKQYKDDPEKNPNSLR